MSDAVYIPNVATLCYLIDEKNNKILLGKKKYGGAKGKVNGFGGKVEEKDKTIKEAAIREFTEETNVQLKELELVSIISFHSKDTSSNENKSVKIFTFTSNSWTGTPEESEEMSVEWFDRKQIPFEEMWENDRLWFNVVMSGKKSTIDLYTVDGNLSEIRVEFTEQLNEKI